MKIHILSAIAAFAALCGSSRTVTDLSGGGWTADGESVSVPHTWNAVDAADGLGSTKRASSSAESYVRKAVVYRRALPDANPADGKRRFLRVEGASIKAVVKVNGVEVGRHVGAFTAFVVDITKAYRASGNTLEIEVDNRFDNETPPLSADFSMYGGLIRPVKLIVTDALYFDSTPDGGPGVVVDADAATGEVRVTPRTSGAESPEFAVRVEGPGLARPLQAKGLSLVVPQPRLWTPETPNVYRLTVVAAKGALRDKVSLPFGFRTVEFRKDGFYLNGKRRRMHGVNLHQDREGKGWAISDEDRREDIAAIKELGATAVRTAHYPHADATYDFCDELGLLAWLEMPNVNLLRLTSGYRVNALSLARETIAQYRHHPSVFLWSWSNELKLHQSEGSEADKLAFCRELDSLCREADPSRPTALANFVVGQTELYKIPQAVGFNIYPGWYRSVADRVDATLDQIFKANSNLTTMAISEYGAGSTPGDHATIDRRCGTVEKFHSEEYAAFVHAYNYEGLLADERIWGTFVWLMYDFGADARREGSRFGLNDKGLMGFDHKYKKEPYYFYRANWNPEPQLHLVGEKMSVVSNSLVGVMGFSNVGEVSLNVNGKEYGSLIPNLVNTVHWREIPLHEGENRIRLEAGGMKAEAVWTLVGSAESLPAGAERVTVTPGEGVAAAQAKVRVLKESGRAKNGVVVEFEDGVYRFREPLVMDGRDSGGGNGAPVVWKAKNRGKVVFTGGAELSWRRPKKDDANLALVPEAVRGKVLVADAPCTGPVPGFTSFGCGSDTSKKAEQETPLSFWQGDRRLVCARWPQDSWALIGKQLGTNWVPKENDPREKVCFDGIFEVDAKGHLENWAREPDLWAHGRWYFKWADSTKRILSVDPARGAITADMSCETWGARKGGDYYVINAFSEMDEPGEWAVDRKNRLVYVYPHPDGDAIETPCSSNLVCASALSDFRFEGIVFRCSGSHALLFRDATNVQVVASEIRNTGGDGIRVAGGAGCRVEGCDLYDLGEGGVYLKGGDYDSLVPARHEAVNNNIHHYGLVIMNYRPGVSLNGVGCRAVHNLIHHGDHQGIQFFGNDHVIAYNVLHDLCLNNDDAGIIYGYMCDLTMRGSVIEYNAIMATGRPDSQHVEAIYLDAWTSGCTVRGNLVNRAPLGIWASGGQATRIEKNILMNCTRSIMRGNLGPACAHTKSSWSLGFKSGRFERMVRNRAMYEKPPWVARYPKMLDALDLDGKFAHSALWVSIVDNFLFGCGQIYCHHWDITGPYTTIGGNEAAMGDPGFTDYFGMDWTLRPDSSLRRKIGGDTRFAQMGLFDSPLRFSKAVKFDADVSRPTKLIGGGNPARTRIDITCDVNLPNGVENFAGGATNCSVVTWGRGRRIVADFGVSAGEFREHSFSFVPEIDGTLTVWLMGGSGEMTAYDNFRADGVEIKNPDFSEGAKSWGKTKDGSSDPLFVGGIVRPYGVIDFDGNRAGVANDGFRTYQNGIKFVKGRRVTITFRAREVKP